MKTLNINANFQEDRIIRIIKFDVFNLFHIQFRGNGRVAPPMNERAKYPAPGFSHFFIKVVLKSLRKPGLKYNNLFDSVIIDSYD